MKVVEAKLVTGELVTITNEASVAFIEHRTDWRQTDPFEAEVQGSPGFAVRVNPKSIVWLRLMEKG